MKILMVLILVMQGLTLFVVGYDYSQKLNDIGRDIRLLENMQSELELLITTEHKAIQQLINLQ